MQCKFLLLSAFLFIAIGCHANEKVTIDYHYTKDPGVDFSQMSRGPLKVNAFTDSREIDNKNEIKITNTDTNKQTSVETKLPVSETVTRAFSEAFTAGGAKLVESGGKLLLQGDLLELNAKQTSDEIEVSVKTNFILQNNGKKVWGNTLTSRASVSKDEGVEAAVTAALNKLVADFFYDDYFLMEVVD